MSQKILAKENRLKYDVIVPTITDRKVGFEFKNRNLELLNQPGFSIPFTIKAHPLKPKWKNIDIFLLNQKDIK